MEHFVQFEDVSKYYQTGSVRIAAADHLNFYVDKGEFCIIVGPSGAGKTTLLNILGGMDTCDEGHVWLDGQDVSHFSEKELTTYRRYDVGFVFQFYNLVQNLTALENVELASEICRDPLDPAATLEEFAQNLRTGRNLDEKREALLHTMACKAAIKGGWTSDPAELKILVEKVQSGEVRYCPHGRPVVVKVTKYELEKLFKRA